jgi:hypothetical protein
MAPTALRGGILMRKTILATMVLVALLFAGSAQAVPIEAGMYFTATHGFGSTLGGEFILKPAKTSVFDPFITFCLQASVGLIADGQTIYYVKSAGDYATFETPANGGDANGKDFLDPRTQWIYANYPNGYGVQWTQPRLADAVQNAVWVLEQEQGKVATADGQFLINMAKTAPWIRALNVTNLGGGEAQDLLGPQTAVPEPGSMLLFGSGLVGLARLARRRRS